jgi:hypothetical protein
MLPQGQRLIETGVPRLLKSPAVRGGTMLSSNVAPLRGTKNSPETGPSPRKLSGEREKNHKERHGSCSQAKRSFDFLNGEEYRSAVSSLDRGAFAAAIHSLRNILVNNPELNEARRNLAFAVFGRGHHEEAVAEYQKIGSPCDRRWCRR